MQRRNASASFVMLVLASTIGASVSCHEEIDTTRAKRFEATFGDDLYGVLCDRLGASSLQEDMTGDSYDGICHYDAEGKYEDKVDVKQLPRTKGGRSDEARRLSVAKMEKLAARRAELVRAFNAAFPDIEIDNLETKQEGDKISLHQAFLSLGQHLVPLYESNPYEPFGEALAPSTTRALGRLFDSMATQKDAQEMLAQMWGRQGYRPFRVGLGAIRATMEYPELRSFTKAALAVMGPNGKAVPELQHMLSVTEREMRFSEVEVSNLGDLVVDVARAQPTRPRGSIELARDLILTQNEGFAATPTVAPRFISLRDRRGYVLPAGNTPGVVGTVAAPFADLDSDGYADVDPFGRFLDDAGAPLSIATPFFVPGRTPTTVDPFGRPIEAYYQYVDTSRSVAAAMTRELLPLLDATRVTDPGDPEAFELENETLMYALAGAPLLFGSRTAAEYDFEHDAVVPGGTGCKTCIKYDRFRGEDSPLVPIVHAVGQILADRDSDAILLGMIDLMQNHENEMARLVAAALKVRAIAVEHDALAAQGKVPDATLPYETPIWDEVADVVSRITEKPGLTAKLLRGLANDVVVTPSGGVAHEGEAVARFAELRDEMSYDPNDINGPAYNVTRGNVSAPSTPVDYNAPRTGTNRSMLMRALQLIHDARLAKTCNKQGAVVKANVLGITLDWPLVGDYDECELFEMPNLAVFYLDSILPAGHPKRSEFILNSGALNGLMDAMSNLGFAGTKDELLEGSSGLTGMTLHPSPQALNRLVWFGAGSSRWGNLPDFDPLNQGEKTETFVSSLIEPVGSIVCPPNVRGVNTCNAPEDLMRSRDRNTIFTWESFGFYDYLRPMITEFVNSTCNEDGTFCDKTDLSGEMLFVDLIDILNRHWQGPENDGECETTGSPADNPRYCSGAGVHRYEPIIAKAGRSDLVPALHEFAKAAHEVSKITIARGDKAGTVLRGSEVLEIVTKVLFSKQYARDVGMLDHQGRKATAWVDGTPQDQVTPFAMFADGLHAMDQAFAAAGPDGAVRQRMWRRARSQLVDVFLAVEGEGESARFKSRSIVPITVSLLSLVREQVNAHCPEREKGVECVWAKQELSKKLGDALSGPMVAAAIDMFEAIRTDDTARRELERLATHLLKDAQDGEVLQGTLASMVDVMQVLADDAKLVPIMRAAAVAAKPDGDPDGAGCADRTLRVLKALTDDEYDVHHVMDVILKNLATPIDDGGAESLSPLEVIMDVIADVNRIDPSDPGPLRPADYENILGTVRDFLIDDTRGLEQFYAIVNKRQRK